MRQPTVTTNRLHFTDLDPLRFEDLCLNMVSRLHEWKELNHFGRKGSDSGVDIFAVKSESDGDREWYIQCKRYSSITKTNLTEIVDKAFLNPSLPDKLLIIVSCDVSRANYEFLKGYAEKRGIQDLEIWTSSIIEAKLYKDYKDLLFVYFGIRIDKVEKDNAASVKQKLRMQKRVSKELLDNKYLKENKDYRVLLYRPYQKFITHKVYIRSVEDTTYPESLPTPKGQISPWFRTFFYDLYHNGIEFWLDAGMGTTIIMDKDGNWEPVYRFDDKRVEDSKYKTVKAMEIGRIAYNNIVDFTVDGDEYTYEPHLFCKFNINGAPYEEIYYKTLGDPDKEVASWDFPKSKRVVFPK